MSDTNVLSNRRDINLKNPFLAGLLAWFLPGLGHYYQGRYHKALIFFVCIMPMFVAGCVFGSGTDTGAVRNVYWSWRNGDMRFWWLAQAPLGIAAIPSWVQAMQINAKHPPMLGRFMSPPKLHSKDASGTPPTLDKIRQTLTLFELGTYLTVIAGLMNLLVIFDAVEGPFLGKKEENNNATASAKSE